MWYQGLTWYFCFFGSSFFFNPGSTTHWLCDLCVLPNLSESQFSQASVLSPSKMVAIIFATLTPLFSKCKDLQVQSASQIKSIKSSMVHHISLPNFLLPLDIIILDYILVSVTDPKYRVLSKIEIYFLDRERLDDMQFNADMVYLFHKLLKDPIPSILLLLCVNVQYQGYLMAQDSCSSSSHPVYIVASRKEERTTKKLEYVLPIT